MRTVIFWCIIGGLLYAGVMNIVGLSEGEPPLEIPFLDGIPTDFSIILPKQEKVAPIEQWSEILLGSWNYHIIENEVESRHRYSGQIEYKPDGKFVKTLTYKAEDREFD